MTFYDWIITKKDMHNPVGGMSRDIIAYNDNDKIKNLNYEEWKKYLSDCNACELVMETFDLIWNKYQQSLKDKEEPKEEKLEKKDEFKPLLKEQLLKE